MFTVTFSLLKTRMFPMKKMTIQTRRGRHWKGVLLCLAPLAAVSSLSAQVIAYDGIDYAAGESVANDTLNGGTGFTGAWVKSNPAREDATVDASGMTYSDGTNNLVTSGLSFTGTSTNSQAVDVERSFSSALSGSFWASWLIESDNVTDAQHVTLLQDAGNTEFVFVRMAGGQITAETNVGGSPPSPAVALASAAADTTYLITAEYRSITGAANDEFQIWVNSDLGGAAPSTTDTATITMTGGDIDPIDLFRWRVVNDGSNGTGLLDEIRVGNSFADVAPIPEPGTSALLAGLTGLGLAMLRRRR